MQKLKSLYSKFSYQFNNPLLLQQALTHCSASSINNERLEFLGDSILSAVISEALYFKFPDYSEGQLSRLRASLVKGEFLGSIAKTLHLGDYVFLGPGELRSSGFKRTSILADALEAIFGAIFLDGGFAASKESILYLYQSKLSDECLTGDLQDPKTKLQEYVQSLKMALPLYALEKIDGQEHEQIFHVSCSVAGLPYLSNGFGETRRKAEQMAAQDFLAKMIKVQSLK